MSDAIYGQTDSILIEPEPKSNPSGKMGLQLMGFCNQLMSHTITTSSCNESKSPSSYTVKLAVNKKPKKPTIIVGIRIIFLIFQ
ncbi:hypothetical protein K0U27_00290 [archaeon]|nr:hypothetical protein [archaeon]